MYYMLDCRAPAGHYPAMVTYRPDRPGRSWILGRRFEPPMPEPVRATVKMRKKSVLTELVKVPLPLMSARLHRVLQEAGVSNLDVYRAEIKDEDSGQIHADHLAFNIIGVIAAADLAKSIYVAPDGPMVSVDFDSLAIDAARARGALMFRLAESVSGIVVHESVRKAVEAAGIDGLSFTVPADWAG